MDSLPDKVLLQVLDLLDTQSRGMFCQVNRRFRRMVVEGFWKEDLLFHVNNDPYLFIELKNHKLTKHMVKNFQLQSPKIQSKIKWFYNILRSMPARWTRGQFFVKTYKPHTPEMEVMDRVSCCLVYNDIIIVGLLSGMIRIFCFAETYDYEVGTLNDPPDGMTCCSNGSLHPFKMAMHDSFLVATGYDKQSLELYDVTKIYSYKSVATFTPPYTGESHFPHHHYIHDLGINKTIVAAMVDVTVYIWRYDPATEMMGMESTPPYFTIVVGWPAFRTASIRRNAIEMNNDYIVSLINHPNGNIFFKLCKVFELPMTPRDISYRKDSNATNVFIEKIILSRSTKLAILQRQAVFYEDYIVYVKDIASESYIFNLSRSESLTQIERYPLQWVGDTLFLLVSSEVGSHASEPYVLASVNCRCKGKLSVYNAIKINSRRVLLHVGRSRIRFVDHKTYRVPLPVFFHKDVGPPMNHPFFLEYNFWPGSPPDYPHGWDYTQIV